MFYWYYKYFFLLLNHVKMKQKIANIISQEKRIQLRSRKCKFLSRLPFFTIHFFPVQCLKKKITIIRSFHFISISDHIRFQMFINKSTFHISRVSYVVFTIIYCYTNSMKKKPWNVMQKEYKTLATIREWYMKCISFKLEWESRFFFYIKYAIE